MGAASQSTGYEINQSIRFDKATSSHLSNTYGSAGNRKTWTFSTWFKRGTIDASRQVLFSATGLAYLQVGPDAADREMITILNEGSGTNLNWYTTQVFRDPSAWYHIVWQFDTTQADADNRTKLYINGSQVTDFTKAATPAQDFEGAISNAVEHKLGEGHVENFYLDGYQAEINFIDGTALAPTAFGEYNDDGVWIPKKYSGAYGTNGFFIDGRDSSDLGDDESGNGNDFASSGLTTADQMGDTPTKNFCTWNPLDKNASITLSDGNLKLAVGNVDSSVRSTFAASSGKWYWEITITSSSGHGTVGVTNSLHSLSSTPGNSTVGVGYRCSDGGKLINGTYTASYGASYTTGDVIGVALNMEDGEVTFYKNNASQGVAATGLSGTLFAAAGNENVSSLTWTANFGQTAFTYTPPTDFLALNTANLATPSITDGSKYFQTTLYTGTGSSRSVDQSGNSTFQPDWVWVKSRNAGYDHALYDAVRGVQKELKSNDSGAEATITTGLTAFESDGFQVGSRIGMNGSSDTFVAWQWLANGSGSSNEDGSVTSTVSNNSTSNFSIVKYTGTGSGNSTVGHGLGVTPDMIIVKHLDRAQFWRVFHTSVGVGKTLFLNSTAAAAADPDRITAVSSTTFTATANMNESADYIAYCFAEIPGYSSIGSYEGNGNANGSFVYTGFRPSFLLVKNIDAVESWQIRDSKRDPFNVSKEILYPDTSGAEATSGGGQFGDLLSNGFKWRGADGGNNSAATFIYMAFAENPFGGDGVAPATAR